MTRILTLGFLVVCSFPVRFLLAASTPKIVLTVAPYALASDDEFTCSGGDVNGYITLPAPVQGRHTMESIWIKPDGTVESYSKSNLEYPSNGGQTAHIWLGFGSDSGLLSSVRDQDVSDTSKSGDWRVEVKWDGQPLVQSKFRVKC